jgi:hypothetical protein
LTSLASTAVGIESVRDSVIPTTTGRGPHTRVLLRRTGVFYVLVCALGLLPSLTGASASLQSFGLGLWFPGAGFVAVGGWSMLWILPTLVLMALALFAWFGAGMVVAPIAVWLGAALAAAAMTGAAIWTPAPSVVVASVAAIGMAAARGLARRRVEQIERREARNRYLTSDTANVAVRVEVADAAKPKVGDDELGADQLSALRFCLDRALQPVDGFTGFDRIDQFQTSAIRYQINQLGWTLAVAQGRYTPSFHGYLSDAQLRLIDKYLLPQVLGYWRWESLWGHLNLDPDPVGRDNIMLTGYVGLNVALYAGNTGDRRHFAPDSLVFRVSDKHVYRHRAEDLVDSLMANYARYREGFCLFPCEPNWVYPNCNVRGLKTLTAFDRVLGTSNAAAVRERFRERLESDFMAPDSSLVSLRSNLTGFAVPFPVPDAILPKELNPVFPDLAHRYWAIVRRECMEKQDGRWRLKIPARNVDYGNYTFNDVFVIDSFLGSAREMGDDEIAEAALARLDGEARRTVEDGALFFRGVSTFANATIAMDRLLRPNGWRDAVTTPPPASVFAGPLLADAPYPDVLVAKAFSRGENLELVLHPGRAAGPQPLRFERLRPGRRYVLRGADDLPVAADERGSAAVSVTLRERTVLELRPAD